MMAWPSQPMNTRADAVADVLTDILSSGKNSRLYKRLVYEKQMAQSATAYQGGAEIAGELGIQVTAKQGVSLTEIEAEVRAALEDVVKNGVTEREIQTVVNNKEMQLVSNKATVFGKANSLATYHTLTGDAENINREFDRFAGITPDEVQDFARSVFEGNGVVLSVVPNGKRDLAAQQRTVKRKEGVE
jgi:zinc protease